MSRKEVQACAGSAADAVLLSVQTRETWLALYAAPVVEILGERPWVPIPDAPAPTPGIMAWHGRVIAVVDLGALGGGSALLTPGECRPRTVVVQTGALTFALPVDAVREVEEVSGDRLAPPHATSYRFSAGEVELHGVLMPVLDLPAAVQALAGEG